MLKELLIKSLKADFPELEISSTTSFSPQVEQFVVPGYSSLVFTIRRHPEKFTKSIQIFDVEIVQNNGWQEHHKPKEYIIRGVIE